MKDGHKQSCVRSLFQRIESHCNTQESKDEEERRLFKIFEFNGYPRNFIRRSRRNAIPNRSKPETTRQKVAVIPYIKNISEMTARILRPYGIRVAHKPAAYIKSALSKPKDKIQKMDKSNTVYRVNCFDCPKHYNGQTSRRLQTRMKEHKRQIKNHNANSLIYVHQATNDHKMDVEHPEILAQAKTKNAREFLESWFSKSNSINRRIVLNPIYWSPRDKKAP